MNSQQLTNHETAATTVAMQHSGEWHRARWNRTAVAVGMAVLSALAVGGCISINAPDKPIVIELNINIKQEVVYRLAADAGKTVDDNAAIF